MSRDSHAAGPNADECAAIRTVIPWRSRIHPSYKRFPPSYGWPWRRHAGSPANDNHPGLRGMPVSLPRIHRFPIRRRQDLYGLLPGQTGCLVRAKPRCLEDDITVLPPACRHRKQWIQACPGPSPSQPDSRSGQPSAALLFLWPRDSHFCQPAQPDHNTSPGHQSPPVGRQAAETTAALAERTPTLIRNR